MIVIKLADYGDKFMLIDGFDQVLNRLINEVENGQSLSINFEGIQIISPSYMTRLLHGLIVNLNPKDIKLENANPRIESTFKFALYSIKLKNANEKADHILQIIGGK